MSVSCEACGVPDGPHSHGAIVEWIDTPRGSVPLCNECHAAIAENER